MADLVTIGTAVAKLKLFSDKDFLKILISIILGSVVLMAFIITMIAGWICIFLPSPSIQNVYISNVKFTEGLGVLSEKYESNGKPGVIGNNKGDIGGKSYGAWQIASKVGSMNSFLNWLKAYDNGLYIRLNTEKEKDKGYGSNFDREWIKIANENSEYFYQVQWTFIKSHHYDPVVKAFKKKGIDFEKRSTTLRNVIWSTAVQHGYKGAIGIINKQDLKLSDKLEDDEKVIIGIYEERKKVDVYFKSSSRDIQISVYNRFIEEKADAVEMLKQELEKLKGEKKDG
jgi:hypothetical protein